MSSPKSEVSAEQLVANHCFLPFLLLLITFELSLNPQLFPSPSSLPLPPLLTLPISFILQINTFSKEMYLLASSEDSGHYMLYTLFYYNQLPLSSKCRGVLTLFAAEQVLE